VRREQLAEAATVFFSLLSIFWDHLRITYYVFLEEETA